MTKLGQIQSRGDKPTGTKGTSKLAKFASLGSRGEAVNLPLLGPAWCELVAHDKLNEVDSEVAATMEGLKLAPSVFNGISYDRERLVRTLAHAMRDPDDPKHETPFGTVEEWLDLDEDLIVACSNVYTDARTRLDPVGADTLTEEDGLGIAAALEKKSAMGLRFFGVAKLALYMLTMASPRENSPTPPSSPGDSSPATE